MTIQVGDVLVYGALWISSAVIREGVVTAMAKGSIFLQRPEEDLYSRRLRPLLCSQPERPLKWVKTKLFYPNRTFVASRDEKAFREAREAEWLSYWVQEVRSS